MSKLFLFLLLVFFQISCQVDKENIVLDAADFGLKQNEDGTKAIISALENAKETGARKLLIPQGSYYFNSEKALEKYIAISNNDNGMKRMVFYLDGFKNFEIDGQGSSFVFEGEMIPLVIENSENISITGISIDWDKPFYGQAKVVAVNATTHSFDVQICDGFEYEVHKGTLYFNSANGFHDTGKNIFFYPNLGGTVYRVNDYKLEPWSPWHADSYKAEEIEDGLVRINIKPGMKLPEQNWIWVAKGTSRDFDRLSPAIRLYRSFGVDFKDVTIHHSGAMGLIGEKSGDITIDNMRVTPSPKTSRTVSTTADATHFVNCKGTITVKNSYFSHMLDDAINVHGIYTKIVELVDEKTLAIKQIHNEQHGFDFAEKGDSIVVANNLTLEPVDTFIVVDYKWFNEEYQEITLNETIAENVEVDYGVENISWNAGLNFINSTVEKNRARGILFSTKGKVVVKGNKFSNMMAGISISGDNNYWFESGPSNSVLITENQFVNCTSGGKGNSVIMIAPIIRKPELSKSYYNKNITITNNSFKAFDKSILFALSVENLTFSGNSIIHTSDFEPIFEKKATIELNKCKEVLVADNQFNSCQDGSILIDKESADGLKNFENINQTGKIVVKGATEGLDEIL